MVRMKNDASVRNRSFALPAVWVLLELQISLLLALNHSTKFVECAVPEGFGARVYEESPPATVLTPQFSDILQTSVEERIYRRMLRRRRRAPRRYPPPPTVRASPAPSSNRQAPRTYPPMPTVPASPPPPSNNTPTPAPSPSERR